MLAAWSFSKFVFQDDYPFYDLKGFGSTLLHVLIFVEFVWGLCFLKEAGTFNITQPTSASRESPLSGTSTAKITKTRLKSTVP